MSSLLSVSQQRGLPRIERLDWLVAAALAVLTLAGNLASASAIALMSPALLTVLQRAEIIVVALLAWAFVGERVDGRFWLGVAVAALGLLLLQDPQDESRARILGIGWAGISVVCFSAMAVLTRRDIQRPRSIGLVPPTRAYIDSDGWSEIVPAPSTIDVWLGLETGAYDSGLTLRRFAWLRWCSQPAPLDASASPSSSYRSAARPCSMRRFRPCRGSVWRRRS